MVSQVGALGKHLALVGFMGAGKTTIGREVARLTERPFLDTDVEIEKRFGPIARIFEERGEAEFREIEERVVAEALAGPESVLALGGGAVLSPLNRTRLRARAFTVHLEIDVDSAWQRVRGSDRPLAQSEAAFRHLYEERETVYADAADAVAETVEDLLLASLQVHASAGTLASYRGVLWEDVTFAVVGDERVLALYPDALGHGAASVHRVPSGEAAKQLHVAERLWREVTVGRDAFLAAFGGGSTTDVVGFVAATYLRGVRWVAVPTTLVGQVDAAIGGKTGINTPDGKNLAGAFHFPTSVILDPDVLVTLPEEERRQGMAEVVKTGLLAGRPLWELADVEMIRACAAFKCAVCLSDPYEQGRRATLNLGHTFGHALEAASDYRVRHGDAVALGLLAALRLSGRPTDVVEEVLRPEPVRVDRERAWAALRRDKKGAAGRPRLVLLEAPGRPVHGVELSDAEIRAALDALITD